MIQMETKLIVADNSGAKLAKCIKVLGGSNHMISKVGDVIRISIIDVSATSKIKKGSVALAVIIRTKSTIKRSDGSIIKFGDNAVVLVDKDVWYVISNELFIAIFGEKLSKFTF